MICERDGCDRSSSPDGPYCNLLCAGLDARYLAAVRVVDDQEVRQVGGGPHAVDLAIQALEALDQVALSVEAYHQAHDRWLAEWWAIKS